MDETAFGCARQAGGGPNVARQVAHRAGVPKEAPAYTVNMACGSSLKAIDLAFRAVRDGDAEVVLAGGVESMSRVPYLLTGARWGYRMGHQDAVDGMYQDGFLCPLSGQLMGETAETLAEQYRIPRDEQDGFALRSQQRAARAWDEGRFAAETFTVKVPGRKGEVEFAKDEHLRADADLAGPREAPAGLQPEYGDGHGGQLLGDHGRRGGSAGALRGEGEGARRRAHGPRPGGGGRRASTPPGWVSEWCPRSGSSWTGWPCRLPDFDLVELNEAFAAQVLACDRELHIDPSGST